jgi:TRAP-type mannitol/chloroaromatic compound transport system substrate-binding protein
VRSFSPEIMAALKQTSQQVLEEAAAKDPFIKRVYDSYRASLANSMEWGARSEEPYTKARREL